MKKIFATMLLAFALVIVGSQSNQAEAYEQYVGSYSDGTAVYILTETIERNEPGSRLRNTSYSCTCTVKAGNDYLDYWFEGTDYGNSEGYRGNINDGRSPIAKAIYNYCMGR